MEPLSRFEGMEGMKTFKTSILIVVILLGVVLLWAQRQLGTYAGALPQPQAGIEVIAKNLATGTEYKVKTGAAGRFKFEKLPYGEYEIRASVAGFQPYRVQVPSLSLIHI